MKKFMYGSMLLFTMTMLSSNIDAQTKVRTHKKGWSKGAKDAVIGGVGGAAVGAAVSHDHSKGAIIGGVAGAAGGYLIGHKKDKKSGRAN